MREDKHEFSWWFQEDSDNSRITPGYSDSPFQWFLMHSNRIQHPQLGKNGHGWNGSVSRSGSILFLQHYHVRCHSSGGSFLVWLGFLLVFFCLFFFSCAKRRNRGAAGHRELPVSLGRVFWYYKGGIIKGRQKKPLNHATKVNPKSWKTLPLCTQKACYDLAGVWIQRLFCSILAVTETCYLHEYWNPGVRNHPHCCDYTSRPWHDKTTQSSKVLLDLREKNFNYHCFGWHKIWWLCLE